MTPSRILLLACYELGHQPLSLAWPLAFLRSAGYSARVIDLSIEPFCDEDVRHADFVGIAAPMHTALRLGVQVAQRVRAVKPATHICFYGLYAHLNADYLLATVADSVLAGESEASLVELIQTLDSGGDPPPAALSLSRLTFPVPDRASLPRLERYARYIQNGQAGLAGYTEGTRGCLHTCRHCPITPVYNGRFFVAPVEIVLADIRQQVIAGASHLTFGDPDFLNAPGHALKLARALHEAFPYLTFDFTTKVEHILKHHKLFPELARLGCTFVVSAIESLSEVVLARLQKGHTAADIDEALSILDAADIAMQPTLVAFTPWTTLDDYLAQLNFICGRGLIHHIPPIQLAIRLLVPPGSALLALSDTRNWLGELDAEAFTYRWSHPDPRMDQLYEQVSCRVGEGDSLEESPGETFAAIWAIAHRIAGRAVPAWEPTFIRPAPPRLTEHWFC